MRRTPRKTFPTERTLNWAGVRLILNCPRVRVGASVSPPTCCAVGFLIPFFGFQISDTIRLPEPVDLRAGHVTVNVPTDNVPAVEPGLNFITCKSQTTDPEFISKGSTLLVFGDSGNYSDRFTINEAEA
jgi:hypothetical protein